MTTLASADFTGTDGAAWPAAFSSARNTGGSSTISTNRGQQITSAAGGYADYRADYLNFGTTTDGTLTGTFMTPDLNEKFAQVWFRANTTALGTPGGGGGSGYFFSLEPSYNTIRFYKRTTGTQAGLGTAVAFTFASSTIYSWKVQWFGTTLRAKVWTGSEPGSWTVSITDASFGSAGYCGLAVDGGSAAAARQVFWDDIVLDNNSVSIAAAAVSRAAAIPAPSISLGVTVAPAVVARVATVPPPVVNIGPNATINPSPVSAVASVPTPTLIAIRNATVTPPAVARSVQISGVAPFTGQGITVPATAVARAVVIGPHVVQTLTLMQAVAVSRPANVPTPLIDTTGIAKLELLTDRFSIADPGRWLGYEQPEVEASTGLLAITPSSATTFSLTSAFNYTLAESSAYVEAVDVLATGTFTTTMSFGTSSNNVSFVATGGNLIFRERVANVNSDTSLAYNSVTHRWWRFSLSGTTLVWQTSPDGITWTTRRSKTAALAHSNVQFSLSAGRTGAESVATARFDNLNLPAIVPAPAGTPLPDVGCWLEAYDLNSGEFQTRVGDFWEASILDPVDETGLGTFSVSRTAWSISTTDPDGNTVILPNGRSPKTLHTQAYRWFFVENGARRFSFISEVNDKVIGKRDDNDDNVTISGPGIGTVLSWGVALPANISIAATPLIFTNTNWASVWLFLLNEAKSRGAIPTWVTPTFDQYIDSNGVAWPDYGDYEIKPGDNLLSLLQTFQGNIGFSWRMTPDGYLVVAQSYGVDRSATVRFYEGHDIWEAEDHIVGTDVRSDVFIEGGDGMITQAFNTDTRAEWGHREVYVQANAALGPTVSNIFAQGTLAQVRKPVVERQFAIDWNPVDDFGVSLGRRVYVDYGPGDIIGYNNDEEDDGFLNFKLISIALKVGADGQITQEIVAESKREQIVERVKRLLQQSLGGNYVAGVGLGNDVTGGSTTLDSTIGDDKVPGVPIITDITSTSALGDDGIEQAQSQLIWTTPLNTDTTDIVDGDHYEIGYKLVTSTADYSVVVVPWENNQFTIDGLVPNTQYQFRIRAVDFATPINAGDWSGPTFHTTTTDFSAPPQPSAPECATSLISVQITHTLGEAAGGSFNLPIDLDHLEIHQGATFNFAVSTSTLIGKLPCGKAEISGFIKAVGTFTISSTSLQYFKVVAVDRTGNRSVDSPSASSTATLLDNAHISDLTVTKLTAGTLSAAVTLSGSIKTGTSGSRVEMDAAGIRLYNSGGSVVVNLNASTGAGTFAGALSGATGTFSGSLSGATGTFSGNLSAATITASTIVASSFSSSSGSQFVSIDDGSQRINFGNNGDAGYIEAVNDGQDQIRIQSNSGTWIGCLNGTASLNTGAGVVSANDNGAILTSTGGANAYFFADNSNANIYAAGNVNINADGGTYISANNNINLSAGTINLGNGGGGQEIISGSIYNNTSTFAANVGISTTPYARFYRLTSSRRYKVGIETLKGDPYEVLKLRPVTYYDKGQWLRNKMRYEGLSKQVGFIAEETAVLDTIGELLTELDDKDVVSAVNYERVVAPVVLALQDMARRLDIIEATSRTR